MYNIEYKDWRKIQGYARSAHKLFQGAEIGGMAVMEEVEKGEWWLKTPVILKQTISGGNCSLDKEELAHYYTDVAIKRKKNKNRYRFLWWHSHHTMGAFWSGTDDKAIDEFSDGDISFALVVSWKDHPDEHILRISQWDPEEHHTDTEFNIANKPEYNHIAKSIVKEVEKKCSQYVSTVKSTTVQGFGYRKPTSNYSDWKQQTLFKGKVKPTNHNEAYVTILSILEEMNAKLVDKKIPWEEWESDYDALDIFATEHDYEVERPYTFEDAISWIKGRKTEDWIVFDADGTVSDWNQSFGLRGWR